MDIWTIAIEEYQNKSKSLNAFIADNLGVNVFQALSSQWINYLQVPSTMNVYFKQPLCLSSVKFFS